MSILCILILRFDYWTPKAGFIDCQKLLHFTDHHMHHWQSKWVGGDADLCEEASTEIEVAWV
jgi:hypothetical protein